MERYRYLFEVRGHYLDIHADSLDEAKNKLNAGFKYCLDSDEIKCVSRIDLWA